MADRGHNVTSIHENTLACDISRLRAGKETDQASDIFWFLGTNA